jgi:hypothetical protein
VRSRASYIVNLGFVLGLVVVTSVTLPDNQKEAQSSETVMKPIKTTSHVNMDAKMHVMPQLTLVAIPQPSADIQVEAGKQGSVVQQVKPMSQLQALSSSKPARLLPKTEIKKRKITPMTPQRAQLVAVKHQANVIPMSRPQGLKSAIPVARITPLKPKTKPLVVANMAVSSLAQEAVTKEVTQASLNPLPLERVTETTASPKISLPLNMTIEVARPTIADLATARQQLNKGKEAPSIEFLWPSDRNDHRQIYHSLTNCLGMTVGHVNAGGKVTLADGQSARNYNRQIFSPMLRLLNEPSTPAEANLIKALPNQPGAGQLVRIFRKETDAKILAGLRNLTGITGPVTGSLSAEYLLTSRGLYLADITHNGRAINGRIELLKESCG